jgi:hypothetical protein
LPGDEFVGREKCELEHIAIHCTFGKSLDQLIEASLSTKAGGVNRKQWLVEPPGVLALQICRFDFRDGVAVKTNEIVPVELHIDVGNHLLENSL